VDTLIRFTCLRTEAIDFWFWRGFYARFLL